MIHAVEGREKRSDLRPGARVSLLGLELGLIIPRQVLSQGACYGNDVDVGPLARDTDVAGDTQDYRARQYKENLDKISWH